MAQPNFSMNRFPAGLDAWRVDWIGEVDYPDRSSRSKHPSVRVSLSRHEPEVVSGFAALAAMRGNVPSVQQIHRWVSIGVLMMLRVGDIWRDQILVAHADDELETFRGLKIDHGTADLKKAGSSLDGEDFLLPLDQHPWHRDGGTHSHCIRVIVDEHRTLVVPCMEVIRFYFGSSGSMLHRLFAPRLVPADLYTRATKDSGGRLFLDLAEGLSRASAADIGRLASSDVAWRAASLVSQSCLQASVLREPIFPKTNFPFIGRTDLVVRGKWLRDSSGTLNTFVAFRIESCSHPFPFKALHARAFDGSSEAGERADGGSSPSRARKKPDRIDMVEEDGSLHLTGTRRAVRGGRKFPDLDRKQVSCSVDLGAAMSRSSGEALEAVTAHAVGEPGSHEPVRPIELEDAEERKKLSAMPRYLRVVVESLQLVPTIASTVLSAGSEDGWTLSLRELSPETNFGPRDGDPDRRVLAIRLARNARAALLTVVDADSLMFSLVEVEPTDFGDLLKTVVVNAQRLMSHEADCIESVGLSLTDLDHARATFALHALTWFDEIEGRLRPG